jgi:hypothetical protein
MGEPSVATTPSEATGAVSTSCLLPSYDLGPACGALFFDSTPCPVTGLRDPALRCYNKRGDHEAPSEASARRR